MDEYVLKELMSTDVLSVGASSSLSEITRLMNEHRYSCLIVTEEDKPVGIVTERDIVRYISKFLDETDMGTTTASKLMSASLITLNQQQSIQEALVVSTVNKVRHIPIVDDEGYLTGIVTYTDIANFNRRMLESQTAVIEKMIAEKTSELVAANNHLKEISLTDPLLNIGNRRAMEIDLRSTHDLSKRYSHKYAVVMIDVDNFKKYNDHYGHQLGDETLVKIADSIKQAVRSSDRVYRYGGEEILVLLPETGKDGALKLSERLLSSIRELSIAHCESAAKIVTVSCGVSIYDNDCDISWDELVKQADEALYQAKSNGRDRVASSF